MASKHGTKSKHDEEDVPSESERRLEDALKGQPVETTTETKVENEPVATTSSSGEPAQPEIRMSPILSMRQSIDQLMEQRKFHEGEIAKHQTEIDNINSSILEMKEEMDQITDQILAEREERDRESGNVGTGTSRRGVRATRGGKPTGTSIALEILESSHGRMKVEDLRQEMRKRRVRNVYSPVESLEKSGQIKRENGDVILQEQQ